MMEFPTLVYKCPGEHHAHDGLTYKWAGVVNQEDLDKWVAAGWSESLVKAVDSFKNPVAVIEKPVPSDDAAPSREELEAKATELGIKFDGRTSDAKLLKLINESL